MTAPAEPLTCTTMYRDTPHAECGGPAAWWLVSPMGRVPICDPCAEQFKPAIAEGRMVPTTSDEPYAAGEITLEPITEGEAGG